MSPILLNFGTATRASGRNGVANEKECVGFVSHKSYIRCGASVVVVKRVVHVLCPSLCVPIFNICVCIDVGSIGMFFWFPLYVSRSGRLVLGWRF